MASTAQVLANTENAKHSTGPKTEAGKAVTKLNACKHGLTAQTLVLSPEDMRAYQEYSATFLAEYEPVGPMESQIAQTIIDANWRLNKIVVLEANLFSLARLEPAPEHLADLPDSPAKSAMLEAHALTTHERQFRNLHLQESRLRRTLDQAIGHLVALQEHRSNQEQEARDRDAAADKRKAAAPQPNDPQPIGSVFLTSEASPEAAPETAAQPSSNSKKAAAA